MTVSFEEYEDDYYREQVQQNVIRIGTDAVVDAVLRGQHVLPEEYHPFLVEILETLRNE